MYAPAQALIAELEAEAAATRRVLERVPADRLEWRPHPKSMTLGQLAHHVATIPGRVTSMARGDGFDASTAKFLPDQPESAASLLPDLEASVAGARQFLSELTEDTAGAPWHMRKGDQPVFTVPRIGVVRTVALNHWYHHRGQLLVYLRLLDVPVPVVYGRSADENPFA
ncbi:MAG: DinB family protein [Vicinamibacterales bacterium]